QAVRPLPELPKDTSNTYLHRTLEEARDKLAAYNAGGDSNTAKFDEVMRMLDDIGTATPEKRTTSAPVPYLPDHIGGFLPMITEESDARSSREGLGDWRPVTSPTIPERRHNIHVEDRTVRIVQPSSPGTVAPLNVRKRSNGSEASDDSKSRLQPRGLRQPLERKRSHGQESVLEPIDEDSVLPTQPTLRKKKSWFGLARWTQEPDASLARPVTPSGMLDEETSGMRRSSNLLGKLQKSEKLLPQEPPHSALSSEFPIRKKRFGGSKKGFSKWLGRKGRSGAEEGDTTGQDTSRNTIEILSLTDERPVSTTLGNNSLDSLFSTTSPSPSIAGPTTSGPERSWFARFLNIKPATDLLCFSIPRGRARQELVLLLKEWQRHGIRDLQYSREQNTMSARVDRNNALDIKAVTFRIEIFVVLEHGCKVGLSIARFVQVKGAASGFRKVLEVIDGVMRGRGWLVEDREKWKALCEVVGA
ncbi:serine/threonine-protein kinase gin4, partial [Oleoguttula sp. CCFEE 5521]